MYFQMLHANGRILYQTVRCKDSSQFMGLLMTYRNCHSCSLSFLSPVVLRMWPNSLNHLFLGTCGNVILVDLSNYIGEIISIITDRNYVQK